MKRISLIAVLLCISSVSLISRQIPIATGWILSDSSGKISVPAKIPGSVHTDLIAAGVIPDPFAGVNNLNLGWVDEKVWIYSTEFDIPDEPAQSKKEGNPALWLVFEGLDTKADVYLNDRLIISADNMFRTWRADVNSLVKKGSNSLKVIFYPAVKYVKERGANYRFNLPGGEWAHIRKAAYHFGWDWGPRFVTCGIWKPVYLEREERFSARNTWIRTLSIAPESAGMEFGMDFYTAQKGEYKFEIRESATGRLLTSFKNELRAGINHVVKIFDIDSPMLWWPNGSGEQNLYDVNVVVSTRGKIVANEPHTFGIRSVELVNRGDSKGTSFYFNVNGKPIFMKGANIIPPHSFMTEVADSVYEKLVIEAVKSNFNMLRVWGGGVYLPDAFYRACSKYGIAVWQDFMFACSMYPWDTDYMNNVKLEAAEQISRLRRFPCIVLWCGNNEIDEGWNNWGWKNQIGDAPNAADSIWRGYESLFKKLLPEAVSYYSPGIPYWQSSPQYGWSHDESLIHGDAHYWGVWWGKLPFSLYAEKVPRFMSEYGFQGAPVYETIMRFSSDGLNLPDSLEMAAHQKHPAGFETISAFIEREGLTPGNMREWSYFSQIIQTLGYKKAIEEHRLAAPFCMGTLYWQFNDCWPVVSWSGIDSYGRWKSVQYAIRDLYRASVIASEYSKGVIRTRVISDSGTSEAGVVNVYVKNMSGETIGTHKYDFERASGDGCEEYKLNLKIEDTCGTLLYSELDLGGEHFESYNLNCRLGDLKLSDPRISFVREGNTLILRSNAIAIFVQIEGENGYLPAGNNYFHMLPGRDYRVKIPDSYDGTVIVNSLYDYIGTHKK